MSRTKVVAFGLNRESSASRFLFRRLGAFDLQIKTRLRRGGIFFGLELLAQLSALAAAFIIVRSLSKTEYGWYTLANNLQGALAIFSAMGVSTGLLSLGGECRGDRLKMGEVMRAATAQRRLLLFVGAAAALPIFAFLLWRNRCPPLQTAALVIFPALVIGQMMVAQMAATPLNLARRYEIPQLSDAITAGLRFAFIAILAASGWLSAVSALLITTVVGIAVVWKYLLPRARSYYDEVDIASKEILLRFRRLLWHSMPSTLSYMFEAQMATLFVAAVGKSGSLADLGAVARLGLLLAIPSALVNKVLAPRLAAEHEPERLRKIWLGGLLFGVVGGLALVTTTILFRHQALWILGPQYSGLDRELVLYAGFGGFWFLGTAAFQIIHSRGWIRHLWMRPVCVFAGQALTLFFISPSTVAGAIILMWGGAAGNFLLEAVLLVNGFRGKGRV
jgi:O-antigen/teichoic acid export membrane protein